MTASTIVPTNTSESINYWVEFQDFLSFYESDDIIVTADKLERFLGNPGGYIVDGLIYQGLRRGWLVDLGSGEFGIAQTTDKVILIAQEFEPGRFKRAKYFGADRVVSVYNGQLYANTAELPRAIVNAIDYALSDTAISSVDCVTEAGGKYRVKVIH